MSLLIQLTKQMALRVLVLWGLLLVPSVAMSYTIDTTPTAPTSVTGLWWNQNESGWGITVTQQGSTIFATFFTYDAAGNPYWYVASNCAISGDRCTGDLFRVRGGTPPTAPWNGSGVTASNVGTLTMTFADLNNATMAYSIDGVFAGKTITRQIFGQVPPSGNVNYQLSAKLVGGTWYFSYTIISTFNDTYTFTSVDGTPSASSGTYYANGRDSTGGTVIGGYYPPSNYWSILDPGSIIDKFYTFTFSDNNHISGCYYQVSPPGSTNLSRCYPLTGYRSPAIAATLKSDPTRLLHEVASDKSTGFIEEGALEAYLSIRRQLH